MIVSDYLRYEKSEVLRTDAFYFTKIAAVKGILRFTKDYMYFEPISCPENDTVRFIDYLTVIS